MATYPSSANMAQSFLESAAFIAKVPDPLLTASRTVQQDAVARGWQIANAKQAHISDELDEKIKTQMDDFKVAFHKFKSEAKPKHVVDIDLTVAHNLEEVIAFISAASSAREGRKDFWGRVLHNFREIGNKSDVYKQWLELLPTQNDYLSVLCGGLKLIIGAMQGMRKVREGVSCSLETLPTMLLCSAKVDEIFIDFELQICSRKMMGQTFDVLRCIVVELTRSSAVTFAKAVFLQDAYAQELEASLGRLNMLHDQYKELATTCSYRSIRNVETSVQDLSDQITIESHATRQQLAQLFRGFCELWSKEWLDHHRQPVPRDDRRDSGQLIEVNHLREAVLQTLAVDPDQPRAQLLAIKTQVWRGPAEVQDRLYALMCNSHLISWFTDPEPRILFINENRKVRGSPSATSHLCAKICETVQGQTKPGLEEPFAPICINYFCTPDLAESIYHDPIPSDMLRSLIGQLICIYDGFDLRKTNKRLTKRGQDNFAQLWRIFESLVMQLPSPATLFCLIDNITIFEVSESREETTDLVLKLQALSEALSGRCLFKIMLTSHERSRFVAHALHADEVIEIPLTVPKAGDISEHIWLPLGNE